MTGDRRRSNQLEVAHQQHRDEIRSAEIRWIADQLGEPCTILELGSGNGRQAVALTERGHRVLGLDLPHGRYAGTEVFDVVYYDGRRLPVGSSSVDVVFTSHALEHVVDLDSVLDEARRVLRPGGRGVHVMPTATWRAVTILARYGLLARAATTRLRRGRGRADTAPEPAPDPAVAHTGAPGTTPSLRSIALPSVHGAAGNAWTELCTFTERAWRRRLAAAGWRVDRVQPGGLLYSGSHLFGSTLPLEQRRRLARVFGSSSKLYEVRPLHW